MKKLTLAVALIAGFSVVSSAFAGFGGVNIGSSGISVDTKQVVKTVAKKGIEKELNKWIEKQNCAFKNSKTVNETTCSLDAIISKIDAWSSGLKAAGISSGVNLNVEASANTAALSNKRYDFIVNKFRSHFRSRGYGWWYYPAYSSTSNGDALKVWASVN